MIVAAMSRLLLIIAMLVSSINAQLIAPAGQLAPIAPFAPRMEAARTLAGSPIEPIQPVEVLHAGQRRVSSHPLV